MDSLSPFYLESVKYLEKEGKIQITFSNGKRKICYVENFLPCIILNNEILRKEIIDFLKERFKIKILGNKVYALRFSELIKLANLLAKMFSKQPLLIEPERQFLINKEWSYFQKFDENLTPKKEFFLSDEFDLETTVISIMLKVNIKHASKIAKNEFLITEIFFENEFFKNGFGLCNIQNGDPLYSIKLWNKNLYYEIRNKNLSWEVICCACCKENEPAKSSIATVEILKDNCYVIEPYSESFAKEFHFHNKNKDSRFKMKRDFWLRRFPLGPLEKGKKVRLLLGDALKLVQEGFGKILKINKIWFCKRKEGLLIRILKELMLKRRELIKERKFIRSRSINSAGIFCENLLQNNEKYLMLNKMISLIDRIIFSIPLHICCSSSKFHNKTITYELSL